MVFWGSSETLREMPQDVARGDYGKSIVDYVIE